MQISIVIKTNSGEVQNGKAKSNKNIWKYFHVYMSIISFDVSNSNTMNNNQLKELWLLDQVKQYSTMFYIPSV